MCAVLDTQSDQQKTSTDLLVVFQEVSWLSHNQAVVYFPWPPGLHGSHDVTVYSSLVDTVSNTCWW